MPAVASMRPSIPPFLCLLVGFLGGCGVSPKSTAVAPGLSGGEAEALARQELGVPESASLIAIASTARPAATSALPAALSTYLSMKQGSSGQRVVASFALPLESVDPGFWSDWQPLPLPPATMAFHEAPAELAGITGYYRCRVNAWSPSSSTGWTSASCAQPPANFDSFEVAAYDPVAGLLTVVVKQYY